MKYVKMLMAAAAVLSISLFSTASQAQEDPGPAAYSQALKGKHVMLVPMAMGFDLAQGWSHYIQKEVESFGGTFETRDPNWSVEAGAQAITEAISSDARPDVLIVHAPDLNSYARLLKKAQAAGTYVILIDNPANFAADAFVGSDWDRLGQLEAEAAIKGCGPNSSKKIGLVQGDQVNASSLYQYAGIMKVLEKNKEFQIVAKPDSNWDATTSRNVTTTMLQQHPDVCAIIDFWDGDASGAAAAIRDAKLQDKVFLVTTGGGEKTADCDTLENGTYGAVVMTELHNQSRDINAIIKFLLQSGQPAGTSKTYIYTLEKATDKAGLTANSCWDLKALQAEAAAK
ncbi:ribose transport system substrate-binding protein [Pararhizobium capsulatum DSM 1112]|uniref:Ribose transport system substrate-binding protein n=1 Tax=Pararhizobium capsulatum DSM 1112 TaxID=1121113 RepID=A0ABU0BXF9_9HYPH|nr:sugar ABC transporter substrate-binding protein [Pararhizobium capsulatum]MDQ0322948.1 ribose transport system substrate-binding protein [Pararhizobium capsulatum DSM 1112]